MLPNSMTELIAFTERGLSPEYLFFWGHTQRGSGIDASCLSQWYPSQFSDGDRNFKTAEHYMMFHKAQLFADEEAAAHILSAGDPGRAKAIGRTVRGFDQTTWVSKREAIVADANFLKFSQNSELRNFLLGTTSRVLVEASPVDRVWGIGLTKDEAQRTNPTKWKGLNLLGFALMVARARLSGHEQ